MVFGTGSFVLPFLFQDIPSATLKENQMRKPIVILFLILFALGLSACAKPPVKAVNSPDQQRSHAQGAQDELSSEVHK